MVSRPSPRSKQLERTLHDRIHAYLQTDSVQQSARTPHGGGGGGGASNTNKGLLVFDDTIVMIVYNRVHVHPTIENNRATAEQ